MARRTEKDPSIPTTTSEYENDSQQENDFTQSYSDNGEDARVGQFSAELPLEKEASKGSNFVNTSSERVSPRSVPPVPFEFQPTLIQFSDKEETTDYHFGLIRGYHREMYDENNQKRSVLCCTWERGTSRRITERNRVLAWQIAGVIFGGVFVFLGITFLLVSFLVLWTDAKYYLWNSAAISRYIRNLAIAGLTVLTLGSALVSLCLLVPVCIGRVHIQDFAGIWCTNGDFYIKSPDRSYNPAPNQFLYFDAAVFRDFFGKTKVKRVQPEIHE